LKVLGSSVCACVCVCVCVCVCARAHVRSKPADMHDNGIWMPSSVGEGEKAGCLTKATLFAIRMCIYGLASASSLCLSRVRHYLLPQYDSEVDFGVGGGSTQRTGIQHAQSTPATCARSQDSQDPNPLIRALAVRTMGCIRVDKITEYLCDPLGRCLKVGAGQCAKPGPFCCQEGPATAAVGSAYKMAQAMLWAKSAPLVACHRCTLPKQDDDPYVRKTAAVCVAKLYDINPELVEDRGFLDTLRVRERACCCSAAWAMGLWP